MTLMTLWYGPNNASRALAGKFAPIHPLIFVGTFRHDFDKAQQAKFAQ